jgi:hypothetical protein
MMIRFHTSLSFWVTCHEKITNYFVADDDQFTGTRVNFVVGNNFYCGRVTIGVLGLGVD